MKGYKTLGDATRLIAEKHMKVQDNALTQFIKSAVELLQAQGKNIDDYALITVNSPMHLKDDHSVTVTQGWRLIHVDKLEETPEYGE